MYELNKIKNLKKLNINNKIKNKKNNGRIYINIKKSKLSIKY